MLFRGAIHAHVLMVYPHGPSAPDQESAFAQHRSLNFSFEDLLRAQERREQMMQKQEDTSEIDVTLKNLDKEIEATKAAEDARGKIVKFAVEDLGISELHPKLNPFEWKPPYGLNAVKPKENVLRQTLDENMVSAEKLQQAHERLVNRVQIHGCNFK